MVALPGPKTFLIKNLARRFVMPTGVTIAGAELYFVDREGTMQSVVLMRKEPSKGDQNAKEIFNAALLGADHRVRNASGRGCSASPFA